MVSFDGRTACKVDEVTALPCHIQDGGYALLWQRYDNNKMAAICYSTSSTVQSYTELVFYYQLMHITLKNAELLKHSKLDKNAAPCFGLHRNHLQGSKVSAWLKITRLVDSICVKDVQGFVSAMAAYCDL